MYKYKAFKHPRNLVKFINENTITPVGVYAENGFIILIYAEA